MSKYNPIRIGQPDQLIDLLFFNSEFDFFFNNLHLQIISSIFTKASVEN